MAASAIHKIKHAECFILCIAVNNSSQFMELGTLE